MTEPWNSVFPDPEGQVWGMNMREYFAALAMQGLLARGSYEPKPLHPNMTTSSVPVYFEALAKDAVAQADALISALNK